MAKPPKKVVEYRVYDLPIDFPAILLDGDQWRISDIMSNRLHFHNCMEIGYCHSDSGTLVFEGEKVPFRAGDITFIPRHIPHTTCSAKGTKALWSYVFIDLESMLHDMLPIDAGFELGSPEKPINHYLLNRDQYPRLYFLTTSVLEELRERKANCMPVIRSLLLVLYYELLRILDEQKNRETDQNNKTFVLKPALEYISLYYTGHIEMKTLADLCCLSETHFRRTFVSVMGTSPLSFITAARINQACVLLISTDKSILSIAESVGITSISSFNRSFSQIMGVTPREYRNTSNRDGITPQHKYVLTYKGWTAPDVRPKYFEEGDTGENPPFIEDVQ